MSAISRLDAYQRRHSWFGFPLAVIYKFYDDQGAYLVALITYYGFVSLFPLLLLFVSILGFVLQGDPGLQHSFVQAAVADFPRLGPTVAHSIRSFSGSGTALVIGIAGSIYGGLGFTQAAQTAFNRIYAVPRADRPNPFKSRIRSLLLLLLLGLGVLITTGLSAITTVVSRELPTLAHWIPWASTALSVLMNVGLFLAAFQLLTARRLSTREVLVGGTLAALAWQVLQTFGTYYVSHRLAHASAVYGIFGVVLGLIAWIYLEATAVVFAAEINVVLHRRLWPRALLTPFTDEVILTGPDEQAYSSYSQAQRYKGFERIDVSFDRHDGDTDDRAPGPPR